MPAEARCADCGCPARDHEPADWADLAYGDLGQCLCGCPRYREVSQASVQHELVTSWEARIARARFHAQLRHASAVACELRALRRIADEQSRSAELAPMGRRGWAARRDRAEALMMAWGIDPATAVQGELF